MTGQQTETLVVLFAEFAPSTELSDRRGDAEMDVTRHEQFHLMRGVATAAGGQAEKRPGDGLTVVFRSAIQALNASLAMQRALAQHHAGPDSTRLAVRIGVHAGDPARYGDLGTLIDAVRRLCESAAGGQILVSDPVRSLLGSQGRFHLRALGGRDLRDLAGAVMTHELVWGGLVPPSDGGTPVREARGRMRRLVLLGTTTAAAIAILLALVAGGDRDGAPSTVGASAPSAAARASSSATAVPLDARSCVLTIEELLTTRRSSGGREIADLHLTMMNHANAAVRSWKIGLSLSDALGNERITIALEADSADIPAGGTESSVWSFADSSYSALLLEHESGGTRSDAEPESDGLYDHLVRLSQGALGVELAWCEVVLFEG